MIDGLPTLSGGGHTGTTGQACIMEYISVLMGYEWTDMPKCTNPVIARVAQRVNDSLEDEDRWLLLEFIPRLTTTSRVPDEYTAIGFDVALIRWLFETYQHNIHPSVVRAISAALAEEYIENQTMFHVISQCIDPIDSKDHADALVGIVKGILDEYDRLAGVEPVEFTQEQYAEATEKVRVFAEV